MELWLENGRLITREAWERRIGQLRECAPAEYRTKEEAVAAVREALVAAVTSRLPQKCFGIFFSAGVDSALMALLAKQARAVFVCYTVGFHEEGMGFPADVLAAGAFAPREQLVLRTRIFSLAEVEALVHRAVEILKPAGLFDAVSVSVAAVVLAALSLARADQLMEFFSGLGAEEIFAGYHRHRKAADVQAECWRGLGAMWSRDLVRDAAVARAYGITMHTPYLDESLIAAAMAVPSKWKIDSQHKKIILREAAEELGVPKEIAWRRKIAAQYGSGFDKALGKLARKHGFRTKGEYLEALAHGRGSGRK